MPHELDTPFPSLQMHLSSRHAMRINGPENCFWHLRAPVTVPPNVDILVSVVNVQIPHSWYNVRHIPHWAAGVAAGNYSVNELLEALNSLGIGQFSYDTSSLKLSRSGDNLTPLSEAGFGFGTGHVSGEAAGVLDLSGVHSVHLASNLHLGTVDSKHMGPCMTLCKIPVTAPPGGVILYTPQLFRMHAREHVITHLNLRLQDEDDVVVPMNGAHWNISLQFDFIYKKQLTRHKTLRHQHRQRKK